MKRKEIARNGATLLMLLAIPTAAAAQAPGIVPGANGAAEVVFADGCVVTYDAEGRRMGLTACSNDEIMAAHEAYAAHLREESQETPVAAAAADDRIPPQVIAEANHEAEVVVSGNCVVHYDAEGRRIRGRSTCSSEQLAEADAAQTAYRQEQGWGDPDADHAMAEDAPAGEVADATVESGMPEVVIDGNGKSRVVFHGGCTVSYDDRGRRTGQTRPCDATQVGSADEAMATYRQEQVP